MIYLSLYSAVCPGMRLGFFYTLIIHNDSKSLFMQRYFRSQALYELFAFLIALCVCCSPCAVYRTHGSLQTTSCGIAFALWLMTPKPRKDISGRHRRALDMNIRAYCCFPGLCSSHSTVSGITDSLSHIFGTGLSSWHCSQLLIWVATNSCGVWWFQWEWLNLACSNTGAFLQT